jgi:hypothetical protein
MPGYSEVSERARQRVDDEKRRIVRGRRTKMPCNSSPRTATAWTGWPRRSSKRKRWTGREAYGAAGLEPPGDYATQASAPAEAPPSRPSVSIPRRAHT